MNNNDVEEIVSNARAKVPLKSIFSSKNKECKNKFNIDHSNWVCNTEIKRLQQSNIDNILNQTENEPEISLGQPETGAGFNQIFDGKSSGAVTETKPDSRKKIDTSKWKDDEDEEEDEEIKKMLENRSAQPVNNILSLTIKEDDYIYKQCSHSTVVGIQLLLGNLKLVFSYLKSQLGIISTAETLKPTMKDLYMCSYSQVQVVPVIPPSEFILRKTVGDRIIPQNGITIKSLEDMLNLAYQDFTDRNWDNALKTFQNILKTSLFYIAVDSQEEAKVKEIISTCTEYIYLIRLTIKSEEVKADKVKYAELTCLTTLCKLDNSLHRFLIYKKAKAACKTIKNYITGVAFLKKMLAYEKELSPMFQEDNPFTVAHNEFEVFQKVGTNQHNLNFNVNENLPNIRSFYCSKTFTKIDKSSVECPLDGSVCKSDFKGQICETCGLTTLGEQVLGLKLTI
jgi:hypothetical protein